MADPVETVPESVAAPEKETEKKEESSKTEEPEVKQDVVEEKNGHSEAEAAPKNGLNGLENGSEVAEKNGTPDKKANGLPAEVEESETVAVSDACPVKRKSEAADIPDSKVSEEDAVSCEKKAKIEEKLAAAKGEEVPNSEEAEATA